MKRTIVIFILASLVLVTTLLWFRTGAENFNLLRQLPFLVILLVIGLALFIGLRRLKSYQKNEPAEDELSKKVLVKTSSVSYYISLYLWLAIMYFSDRVQLESHTLIGAGMLGMAVIFALAWLYFNFRGIRNE